MENKSFDNVSWLLDAVVSNFCMSIVDDSVKANADFQYNAGMSPKIVRTTDGKCCEWCSKLAGTYDYEKVSNTGNNVFRRHKNCTCVVEFHPGDGRKQNVHIKQWSTVDKDDIIKKNKELLKLPNPKQLEFIAEIEQFPKLLGTFSSPEQLYQELVDRGFDVKPLSQGKYKGIPFEDGGGFKINFGGNGMLQYHPEKGSHHEGAYYKLSNSKKGIKRYTLRGDLHVREPIKHNRK